MIQPRWDYSGLPPVERYNEVVDTCNDFAHGAEGGLESRRGNVARTGKAGTRGHRQIRGQNVTPWQCACERWNAAHHRKCRNCWRWKRTHMTTKPKVPKQLDSIADVVLAYKPKARSKPAIQRKRRATKIAKEK
jgi:hypothetical protein